MRTTRLNCLAAFLLVLATTPLAAQAGSAVAVAPVPEQIASAKKVFISNAGLDGMSLAAFRKLGDRNEPYNLFYGAMKAWGRYELTNSPADAELVYELRFTAPLVGVDPEVVEAQFGLVILDAKTHFILWALNEPVGGAFRKGTFVKNVNTGIATLMTDVKQLASPPATASAK